ncbi:TetR/AcrR family transcriptional regulator [Alcaligenaceae bacterium]|nr:TetR/AcrR family transcriptional regulator [Alcaligenaceae bacterium]
MIEKQHKNNVSQASVTAKRAGSNQTAMPTWKSGPKNDKEQTKLKRLAILRAAAQLFNEGGYHATSINELARRLNVTKPTLYYYVKSKDDILLRIQQQAMLDIDPAIIHAQNNGCNGLEKLRLFIERYVVVMTGDFGRCLVLSGVIPLGESSRRELIPAFRSIDRGVRNMIADGIKDGSIRPCDAKMAAFILFGAMHWVTSWYSADGEWTAQHIANEIFSLFDMGLRQRESANG